MKLPSKVKIGPHVVTINLVDSLKDDKGVALYGQSHPARLEIEIDSSNKSTQMQDTVLHEVLHHLFALYRINVKDEERVVSSLTPVLLQIIKENPKMMDFLRG